MRSSYAGGGASVHEKSVQGRPWQKQREGQIYSHQEFLNRKEKGLCFRMASPTTHSIDV